jgi:uncharacterized damage-inducible protein DinB
LTLKTRHRHVIEPILNEAPEIGRRLWAIEDTRQRTLHDLDGLTQAVIDWRLPDEESSIGTVLYHIAFIEADWLFEEVLGQPLPEDLTTLLSIPHRDAEGRLTQVQGFSLEQHLHRMAVVRQYLRDAFQSMTPDEFRRIRSLENYDVSPEWVLHHLMQHEAEHRSQIWALRSVAERVL